MATFEQVLPAYRAGKKIRSGMLTIWLGADQMQYAWDGSNWSPTVHESLIPRLSVALAGNWHVIEEPFELVTVEEVASTAGAVIRDGGTRAFADRVTESYKLALAVVEAAAGYREEVKRAIAGGPLTVPAAPRSTTLSAPAGREVSRERHK